MVGEPIEKEGAPGTVEASGTLNVAVHDGTATATFNIFTQETGSRRVHHVSYGLPVTLEPETPYAIRAHRPGGPDPVHVLLDGTSFEYVAGPPYIAFGLNCQNGVVTYSGATS